MKWKHFAAVKVLALMLALALLSGCGTTVTPPDGWSSAQETAAPDTNEVDSALYFDLSGSMKPFLSRGDLATLIRVVLSLFTAKLPTIHAPTDQNQWSIVSRERLEVSLRDAESYYTCASPLWLLANEPEQFDLNQLNLMVTDLDPNDPDSSESQGAALNELLRKQEGVSVMLLTVPVWMEDGSLHFGLRSNSGSKDFHLKHITTQRDLLVVLFGPDGSVNRCGTQLQKRLEENALPVDSMVCFTSSGNAASSLTAFTPTPFGKGNTDGETVADLNLSRNMAAFDPACLAPETVLAEDILAFSNELDGIKDDHWKLMLTARQSPDPLLRDSLARMRIKDVDVQVFDPETGWRSCDDPPFTIQLDQRKGLNASDNAELSERFGGTLIPAEQPIVTLTVTGEKLLTADYAITLELASVDRSPNASAANANITVQQLMDAAQHWETSHTVSDDLSKLLDYDAFVVQVGQGCYDWDTQTTDTVRILLCHK